MIKKSESLISCSNLTFNLQCIEESFIDDEIKTNIHITVK